MSKRLQVVMSEDEFRCFQSTAEGQGQTLSEWVRQALRAAYDSQQGPSPGSKLRALERALACHHPTGEIGEILEQIEAGRGLP